MVAQIVSSMIAVGQRKFCESLAITCEAPDRKFCKILASSSKFSQVLANTSQVAESGDVTKSHGIVRHHLVVGRKSLILQ